MSTTASGETHESLVNEELGFPLKVTITVGDFPIAGQHRTTANAVSLEVSADAIHYLNFQRGLSRNELNVVAAHEVYHLFYSIRHLITADEETEAETFGHLVGRVHALYEQIT